MPGRALISERHVRDALDAGLSRLGVPENALVTALARDLAADRGLALVPAAELAPAPAATNAPAPPPKTLALGCDHAGFEMKAAMRAHAESLGWTVRDVGTHSAESVDYPDFAFAVARLVQTGEVARGLMIDGVGVGSAMVANKVPGVRAALCPDVFSAFNARAHNDANLLTLGSRTMGVESAKRVLAEFLSVEFEGGRHGRRVDKIRDVEARFLPGDSLPRTRSGDCDCHS
ncbi:MAG TPA: ribose 5-phosphate isomerase B [Bacteroidetes bacterium]|nr:ribose 5-phosphate isomerase B [Bacteroidota bacterium]